MIFHRKRGNRVAKVATLLFNPYEGRDFVEEAVLIGQPLVEVLVAESRELELLNSATAPAIIKFIYRSESNVEELVAILRASSNPISHATGLICAAKSSSSITVKQLLDNAALIAEEHGVGFSEEYLSALQIYPKQKVQALLLETLNETPGNSYKQWIACVWADILHLDTLTNTLEECISNQNFNARYRATITLKRFKN